MAYSVIVLPSAERELRGLPANAVNRLLEAIEALGMQPRPIGVRKLRGFRDRYRTRCGRYRVLYRIDDVAKRVLVYAVGDRKDVYR